ncbi:MAG TPA: cache domain-containing protein [Methanotrichaceae archaeon]|nr:cache domain-containing protein [Methanotrichaceae archaeon]HQI92032.1 cache domain-containing protein [Methanotrichaceae archaeon]
MNKKKWPEERLLIFASAVTLAALLLCAMNSCGQDVPDDRPSVAESEADMLFMLLQTQADLQGELTDSDLDLSDAAQDLSTTGLGSAAAHEVLRSLIDTNSNFVNSITFGKDGRVIAAQVNGSEGIEGSDISGQEHIARLLQAKIPVLSRQIPLLEGYNGTSMAYPVFSPGGEFMGGVSAIIVPGNIIDELASHMLKSDTNDRGNSSAYSFWLMDLDGWLIYDEDASQIGNNLFEDQLYRQFSDLLELGRRIVAERSGHGYYSYFQVVEGNNMSVNKECYWTTAGLHGMEWRLVVTRVIE